MLQNQSETKPRTALKFRNIFGSAFCLQGIFIWADSLTKFVNRQTLWLVLMGDFDIQNY